MSHHQVSARRCLEEASTDDALANGGSAITPAAVGMPRPALRVLESPPPRESRRRAYAHILDPATLSDHIDALYRAARAMCSSQHDAEDLVQETFAQVLKRPRLIRDGNEIAYLMRALRNTYANRFRTASRRPATRELFEHDVPSAHDPDVNAREIMEAISETPPLYRDAVIAVDLLGLSYREAARSLGTREATLTTRLHRGLQHIARTLVGDTTGPSAG
ncbi:MAG: RNA polymerase sigma factor [Solirubrobacteraceae bacterium]